ncbi:MAG: hypothetical protein J0L92_35660 [Deltaproteobacteria bacterium]|nr:hypothetical protein [Deltaproteobacteria bacterium]
MSTRLEDERRARAAARAARPMIFEPIASLHEEAVLHDDDTPEQRLAAMALLCRRAWLASGREWPNRIPRAELPGAVFRIDHADVRRAPR